MTVVGGGLAGCEAAWALAERGVDVRLCEMRPVVRTDGPPDATAWPSWSAAIPSNPPNSSTPTACSRPSCATSAACCWPVPTRPGCPPGAALAVDRELFAEAVHARITAHPRITVERGEVTELPSPGIVATGPLTSSALAADRSPADSERLGARVLRRHRAHRRRESLDHDRLYALSRYGKGKR